MLLWLFQKLNCLSVKKEPQSKGDLDLVDIQYSMCFIRASVRVLVGLDSGLGLVLCLLFSVIQCTSTSLIETFHLSLTLQLNFIVTLKSNSGSLWLSLL